MMRDHPLFLYFIAKNGKMEEVLLKKLSIRTISLCIFHNAPRNLSPSPGRDSQRSVQRHRYAAKSGVCRPNMRAELARSCFRNPCRALDNCRVHGSITLSFELADRRTGDGECAEAAGRRLQAFSRSLVNVLAQNRRSSSGVVLPILARGHL